MKLKKKQRINKGINACSVNMRSGIIPSYGITQNIQGI